MMSIEPPKLSGPELSEFAKFQEYIWEEMHGALVFHDYLGNGKVVSVQMRSNASPLMGMAFPPDPKIYTFNSDAFEDGTISEIIFPMLSPDSVDRWRAQHEPAIARKKAEIEAQRQKERDDAARRDEIKERLERVSEEIEEQLIQEAHKEFLAKHNKLNPGIRRRSSFVSHRITWCWSCKMGIDNSIDYECNACCWILCRCGACGCAYERPVH